MDISKVKFVLECFSEAKRIILVTNDKEKIYDTLRDGLKPQRGYFINESLSSLLKNAGSQEKFFVRDVEFAIYAPLVQFLIIDHEFSNERVNITTISGLREFIVANEKLRSALVGSADMGNCVLYLDLNKVITWKDLVYTCNGEWWDVDLLDSSLPLCNVDLEGVFQLIRKTAEKNPNDLGFRFMGENITLKLQIDCKLRLETDSRLAEILLDKDIKFLLPSFLKGLVHSDNEIFGDYLRRLPKMFPDHKKDILFGLGAACPPADEPRTLFVNELEKYKGNGAISAAGYLNAIASQNFLNDNCIDFMTNLSKSSTDVDEILLICNLFFQNIDACNGDTRLREILRNIIKLPDHKLIYSLDNLLERLVEKNLPLVYELLTIRFRSMAEKSFLKRLVEKLLSNHAESFEMQLTEWFVDGDHNVHRAMLEVSTAAGIDKMNLRLSSKKVGQLSSSEKLYVAYKIAGYIYSKDHLQSLMFSLTRWVNADENRLLSELYNIFSGYIIYNYRTTLDNIKVLLAEKSLPGHLDEFYNSLQTHFEEYFADLNSVSNFKETRADSELAEYHHFYTSQKFSKQFRESRRNGFASFFKETPLHANRWVIRRAGQTVHDPQPLGHFQTNTEFPAGEKLNPVFYESVRISYRLLQKHEVNIG